MSRPHATPSKRRLSGKIAAGVAISVILAFSTFAGPASARWADRDDHRGDQRHDQRDEYRGDDYRGGGWTGGYYAPPPVVYAAPVGGYGYYPPPVVYGPSIGITLPGVSIGIR